MSSFDFGVQFLDPGRMTYWGKRHDPSFWIENASVEWRESEAPPRIVARLTLLHGSHLGPDESKAVYFDATGNSSPDSKPVGSINRGEGIHNRAHYCYKQRAIGVLNIAVTTFLTTIFASIPAACFRKPRSSFSVPATPGKGLVFRAISASICMAEDTRKCESEPSTTASSGFRWHEI